MPKKEIRFSIHDNDGRRAATWKCWSPANKEKSDIYISNRALGGALKVSVHESGKCHLAYIQGFYESSIPDDAKITSDRFIHKWGIPQEIAPGYTLVQRIVTPWSSTTVPFNFGDYKKLHWIDNCPEGKATEIDFVITAPGTAVEGWPGKNSMSNDLIGSFELADGSSLWIVAMVISMPDLASLRGNFKFFRGKNLSHLTGDGIKIIVLGVEPDGSRVLYDCSLKMHPKNAAFAYYLARLREIEASGVKVTLPRGTFFKKFG